MPYDGSTVDALIRPDLPPAHYVLFTRRLIAMLMPSRSFEQAVWRLLQTARARIERPETWCQGHYSNGQGALCLLSALRAAGTWGDPNVLIRARAALLSTTCGTRFSTIELMNDGLQHQQLLAAINQAAQSLASSRSSPFARHRGKINAASGFCFARLPQ